MAEKLGIGALFPDIRLQTTDGSAIHIPDGINAKYKVVLFYRGHW